MAFKKGKPKTGGREKGVQNTLTRTVKEVVLATFNELQEDENHNLTAFAKKNPFGFYQIAAKLIPAEINAHVDHKVITVIAPSKK